MKKALDAAGIKKHLMVQPLGYLTPDASKQGFIDLPEFPFGKFVLLCSRQLDLQDSDYALIVSQLCFKKSISE